MVVEFQPIFKMYAAVKLDLTPQVEVKIKNIGNHHLVLNSPTLRSINKPLEQRWVIWIFRRFSEVSTGYQQKFLVVFLERIPNKIETNLLSNHEFLPGIGIGCNNVVLINPGPSTGSCLKLKAPTDLRLNVWSLPRFSWDFLWWVISCLVCTGDAPQNPGGHSFFPPWIVAKTTANLSLIEVEVVRSLTSWIL